MKTSSRNAQQAVLITADKDFGELVFRQRKSASGVVLRRLAGLSSDRKAGIVREFFAEHESQLLGAFSVITPGKLRIRGDLP